MGEKIKVTVELDMDELQKWVVDGIVEYVKDTALCVIEEHDTIYELIKDVVRNKAREELPHIVDEVRDNCRGDIIERVEEHMLEGV